MSISQDHYVALVDTEAPGLTVEHVKVIALASVGTVLEFLEFNIFIFLAPTIAVLFFPPEIPDFMRILQVMSVFAIGYIGRPIGGIVLGALGDRWGRKRTFGLSVLLIAIATLSIGLLPTYSQIGIWAPMLLLLGRLLQGFSLGGELPGSAIFAGEHVAPKRFGITAGLLTATFPIGSMIGALIVVLLTNEMSRPDLISFGWRIPFVIAAFLGLMSYYLRRYTRETAVFRQLEQRNLLAKRATLKILLSDHRSTLVLCALVAMMVGVITNATVLFPIAYFTTQLHLKLELVQSAELMYLIGVALGCVSVGFAIDRIGVLQIAAPFALLFAVAVFWLYAGLPATADTLGLRWGVVGFFGTGLTVLPIYVLPQVFPANVRMSGFALTYGAGLVLSGATPVLLPILGRISTYAYSVFPAFFAAVSIAAAVALKPRMRPLNGDASG